ncbi:MAG: hypothetical protein EBR09_07545 [Proteobacteria bacterium]|nr:hypothetical protein [Pseudomonadota bacterium]
MSMTDKSKAQMIESTWAKIESRITLEDAINSFINQNLDQCGITICLSAFQLVTQLLDPGGYVRRINKSEYSNLASVLTNPEGPWVEQDKPVNHHWDYTGTWVRNIDKISEDSPNSKVDREKYYPLDKQRVFTTFCEPVQHTDVNKVRSNSILKRYERATFVNGGVQKKDPDYPWSPLQTLYEENNTLFKLKLLDYKLCEAPSHGSLKTKGHEDRVIQRWETKTMQNNRDANSSMNNIEPYWMFDLRSKRQWNDVELKKYKYNENDIIITPIQKPDLVLEIAYTCPKLYFQKKRVVVIEIDGEDKTQQFKRSEENSTRHDYFNINPAKLALKLMQSTSVQSILQPHTYNIRSNFYSYLKQTVSRSLQNTTNFEIPSFQEILNRLTNSNLQNTGLDDFHHLTQTIHVIWHIFRAHVKVAYLIFMREVHDIDIRDGFDETDIDKAINKNMKDHHFFINFTGTNIPNELKFTDKMSEPIKKYLQSKLMLQSPVKIKVYDMTEHDTQGNMIQSKWVNAPIMSTERSNMKEWTARISSGKIPILSNEDATSIPITYASIQRVDINKLCEIVKNVSSNAFASYNKSRIISLKKDGIKRRDFPDRCYLTRRHQLDRSRWWNRQLGDPIDSQYFQNDEQCKKNELRAYGISVRRHTEKFENDLIELNFGYEKPDLKKNYRCVPDDLDKCTWDQVDIRMHYFYQEMEKWKSTHKEDWKSYADGMWYTEDYISFLKMLQSLQVPPEIGVFTGEKCIFTCEPQNNPDKSDNANLSLAVESTKYRLRLHDHKNRKSEILNSIQSIDVFWQSSRNIQFTAKIELLNFKSISEQINILQSSEDGDELYHELDSKIISYISGNNIIIPIFGANIEQNSRKKKRNDKEKTKEKLYFGLISKIEHNDSMKYEVSYIGYEDEIASFDTLQIISAFELYATKTRIDLTQEVDTFFTNVILNFESQVTSTQSQNEKLFSIEHPDKISEQLKKFSIKSTWGFSHQNFQYFHSMPSQSLQQDLAYHVYSILCFFFNCRDDGACRYRWEEWLLDYFGASSKDETRSEFHRFEFQNPTKSTTDYEYYNQTWFQMCFFMEHNFRNAVSALHYKLFEMNEEVGFFPDVSDKTGLQTIARRVYNREKSLLQNRSSFAGLGNVSKGLSFRKYNTRTNVNLTLRDRIMSQLHDELPELDPALAKYVQKFRIPDSELFLRIIRCPNILALRELARQHMSIEPQKHMREVLQFFEPAIQSEIEVMLKFVETDESVYVSTPEAHPSKRLILTETQLLKWMRETLKCSSSASTLGMLNNITPLQCKYDMFLNSSTFYIIKNLFCTPDLLNFGNQRPLKFILLQLALIDKVITSENIEDCIHANDSIYIALNLHDVDITPVGLSFQVDIDNKTLSVPCVINTSRRGWPKRDLNQIVCYKKVSDTTDTQQQNELEMKTIDVFKIRNFNISLVPPCTVIEIISQNETSGTEAHDEMTDSELRKWMLLAYARPCTTLSTEMNVSITQEKFVSNELCKGDCQDIDLHYTEEVHENRRVLSCFIHTVEKYVYFERYEKCYHKDEVHEFPVYVQALIPKKTNSKLIYIPTECAVIFRKIKWPSFFTHEIDNQLYKWRPVYTGLRTWCWKRLLVKMIFLHAFGKVLTRTKSLISLYTKNIDVKNSDISNILKRANEAGLDTFGNLSHREHWLPKEYRKREHKKLHENQKLILSLHEYKCRNYYHPISADHFDTLECCSFTKIQKQHKWLSYTREHYTHLQPLTSCRFLRIDKRFEDEDLTENAYTIASHEGFFMYRDYLYFEKEKTCMVVNVQNAYFVKFPTSFTIRARTHQDTRKNKEIFVCETKYDSLKTKYFLTAFDTRRYNWFNNVHLDTKEDTECIQSYKNIYLQNVTSDIVKTVCDPFDDRIQWGFQFEESFETKIKNLQPGYSISPLSKSSTLFTLPDFYLPEIEAQSLSKIFSGNQKGVETENVTENNLKDDTWWLQSRGRSKFLQYQNATLNQQAAYVFKNEFLADIMTNINRILKPSSSEHT